MTILIIAWYTILVVFIINLSFILIQLIAYSDFMFFIMERHMRLSHLNSCRICFCIFIRLIFTIMIKRNIHPHLAYNNSIFYDPMPSRRLLVSRLNLSFWIFELFFYSFYSAIRIGFSLAYPFTFIKSNNFYIIKSES